MPWFKIWKAGKLKHVKRSTVSGSRLKKISSQCLYIYIYIKMHQLVHMSHIMTYMSFCYIFKTKKYEITGVKYM